MKNLELQILLLIHAALGQKRWPDWLKSVSCENDNDSGEIIFDLGDGQSFVLSTNSIKADTNEENT
jgi:hypothetical protein